ncbi:MAG: hypothetical protein HZB99_01700 [Candidatus Harrisonbacteria bacterium]|nr:hypothetical protein [Candidatus Harrisonbacteria bacterium]
MRKFLPLLALLLLKNGKIPNEVRQSPVVSHNKFGVVFSSKQHDPDWLWQFNVDYRFISRTLWPELLRITNTDPGLRIPIIKLSEEEPFENKILIFGRYMTAQKEIRVYYFNIYSYIGRMNLARRQKLDAKECNVQLYSNIAHELLHYILHMKGISWENQNHHHLMYESGISRGANKFITLYFYSSGLSYATDMSYLREKNDEYLRVAKLNKSSP